MNYKTRFAIFNSISAFLIAYLVQFYGAIGFILAADPTRVTLIILTLYLACTFYLGWKGESSDFDMVKFIGSKFTLIGLAGTVIGMMFLFHEMTAVATMAPLFKGMAVVLITTLFGIVSSILLSFQIAFVFKDYHE